MKKAVRQFTRECAVKYDEILFKNSKTWTNERGEAEFQLDYSQMNLAHNYLVSYIFDMSEDEIAKLQNSEFKELLQQAEAIKDGPLAETTTS